MKVIVSRLARNDVLSLEDYISRDRPRTAIKVGDALYRACEGLVRNALRHPLISSLGLRRKIVQRWIIFYRVDDHVEVVRILDSARDWEAVLEAGD